MQMSGRIISLQNYTIYRNMFSFVVGNNIFSWLIISLVITETKLYMLSINQSRVQCLWFQ